MKTTTNLTDYEGKIIGNVMASPIQATPKLNREETISFVNRLWREQDIKETINLSHSVREAKKKRKK